MSQEPPLEYETPPAPLHAPSVDSETQAQPQESSDAEGVAHAVSDFTIVGVGASAGGLEALRALVSSLHFDSIAMVIVQHLAPNYESKLPVLLSRTTTMQVVAATDGMQVRPNHIYVIPPNAELAILNGTLHVLPPAHGGRPKLSIDFFFRSLADDRGNRAIGVVLSGTGTDGTFGLKAIKEAGGITFVQDPATAAYDGMPRSALDSGNGDFSLAPEAIGRELMSISQHRYHHRAPQSEPRAAETLAKLIVLIRSRFGTDLTYYKPSTIERRIERRLALHKIERLDDYVKFVQANPEEIGALYKDVLISVTSFFRDDEPFEALKTTVFPALMERKQPGSSIRIWIPACSTGEEAYSVAISLLEFLGDRAPEFRIQVFGTDLDEESVAFARRGTYPQNVALDVSPARLTRFFGRKEDEYTINRRVRDMVVFSTQNITKDAPFSKLDLVTCRNLLIYLQPIMQKKVLRVIHYALNADSYLMLGTSETVGDLPELFSLVEQKSKIYVTKHLSSPVPAYGGFGMSLPLTGALGRPIAAPRSGANLAQLADRKILEMYAPPGVIINESLDVLHFRGRTGPYLEPAPGAASLNILRLARPELHAELRGMIQSAFNDEIRATATAKFWFKGQIHGVRMEALPVVDPDTRTRCVLVLFHEQKLAEGGVAAPAGGPSSEPVADDRVHALERELVINKEYLQSTIEELESANEELKSSNEELQSSNEELQSTNEELETSKEELQASNEELATVNDELRLRMIDQQQTADDLHNVFTVLDVPVVLVGLDLRIRKYSVAAEKLLNLVPSDIGRSVAQLNSFATGERVEQLCAEVIDTLVTYTKDVNCADQRWYQLRVVPFKTLEHSIAGVTIGFSDVDVRKRPQLVSQQIAQYAATFLSVIYHPLLMLDSRLRVTWANEAYYAAFGATPDGTLGKALDEASDRRWSDEKLVTLLHGVLASGMKFGPMEVQQPSADGRRSVAHVSGSRIPAMVAETALILLSIRSAPLEST